MISTSRRGFITGLVSFIAAPAIVRAGSLMPVKAVLDDAMIARAMRDYIEKIINPASIAAIQDAMVFGIGTLEFKDGAVTHVLCEPMPIFRPSLPECVRILSGDRTG